MRRHAEGVLLALLATFAPAPGQARAATLICLDAGHGGMDPGGTGTGMEEKVIVLDTVLRLRDLLLADSADPSGGGDWDVIITRGDDTYVSLAGRASYANEHGADRFMSIHSNAYDDPSANGTETFSESDGGTGAALRDLVQDEMLRAWGLRDRGVKTANFAVLTQTAMPSELHELAFITNSNDASFLASGEKREIAARAHLYALQRHYGLDVFDPGTPVISGDRGRIEGTILDDDGVVIGAIVTVDGERPFTTGTDGQFSFSNVSVGLHTVEASAAGHAPGAQDVEVVSGQTATIELVLGGGGGVGPGPGPGDGEPPAGCGCALGRGDVGGSATLAALAALVLAALALSARAAGRRRARRR